MWWILTLVFVASVVIDYFLSRKKSKLQKEINDARDIQIEAMKKLIDIHSERIRHLQDLMVKHIIDKK